MPGSGRPPGRTRTWQVSHETLCRRLTHENYGSATEHQRFGNKGQAHPQELYRPSASRSSTSSNLNCSSPSGSSAPASTSSQVTGVATVGSSRPRSEYGESVVFAPAFCDQSRKTFPDRLDLVMVAVTSLLCSSPRSSATSLASAVESSGSLRRWRAAYRCSPLLPLVTAWVSRLRSARRSRTSSATWQHSCRPAPSPGSRSMTSRFAPCTLPDLVTVHWCTCSSSAARLA